MHQHCPYCLSHPSTPRYSDKIVRKGFFIRKCDGGRLTRYLCKVCSRSFSTATFDPCFRQKKRHFNIRIFEHLASGNTQRRTAKLLRLNKNTVARKFQFVGQRALFQLQSWNEALPQATQVQFDDLETFEHSKLKPLSVTLAVENKTRRFLAFEVSTMPAKGKTAKKSVKKYGVRRDGRKLGRRRLFLKLQKTIEPHAIIDSDSNPHYPQDVREFFPKALHRRRKGIRGSTTGQGELKQTVYDPLFSLNHTCAKLRADICRLIRKTWSTTKKKESLAIHIAIFAVYHNQELKSMWL